MADLWLLDNAVDTASILQTAGTPNLQLHSGHLKDPRLGVLWRAQPGDVLTVTFPSPIVIDAVGLFGIRSTGTFGVATDVTGPMPDQIDPWAAQSLWVAPDYMPDPAAAPRPAKASLTLSITGDACDIGRLWVGTAVWVPAVDHVYGAEQGVEDLSIALRTRRSGAMVADTSQRLRTHMVTYDAVSPDEWNGPTREIALGAGLSKQLLFVPNPQVYDIQKHAMLAYQEAVNPIIAAGFRRFERAFALKEAK